MKVFFQKHGLKLATGTLFTGIGFSFLPERICPENYKIIDGFYVPDPSLRTDKIPHPVPQTLVEMVLEEARKCSPRTDVSKLDPYLTRNLNVVTSFGSPNRRRGAVVGVPINFKYSADKVGPGLAARVGQTDDRALLARELRAYGMTFPSVAASELATPLILSDDAKRFAISRTLHELAYDGFRWKWAAFSVGGLSGLFLWTMAWMSMDLAKSRAWSRGVGVASVFVALANFVLLRGLVINHAEKRADRRCVEMGPSYVVGGYEYYRKSILLNIVSRKLEDFQNRYNARGNETTWFRLKMRTVNRFDHFDEYCKRRTEADVD